MYKGHAHSHYIGPAKGGGFNSPCSYELDGIGKYLELGDILDAVLSGAAPTFTLSATLLRKGTVGFQNILTKWTGQGNLRNFRLGFSGGSEIRVLTSTDGTAVNGFDIRTVNTFTSLIDHYTVDLTFDGSKTGANNVISIYVDGLPETLGVTLVDTSKAIANTAVQLRAGVCVSGAGAFQQFLDAFLNQFHIWDRVLTPTEILDKSGGSAPQNPANFSGLVASYLIDNDTFGGGNFTVIDSSGAGLNGTSVNLVEPDKQCD